MKAKNILLKWLELGKSWFWGWFVYLPVYLFWALGIYFGLLWSGLGVWTYWACFGLVFLIRMLKNTWGFKGNFHWKKPMLQLMKEPYQVPYDQLPVGLCYYGEMLLNKTERDCYVVLTGEPFQYDGKQFSPVAYLPE